MLSIAVMNQSLLRLVVTFSHRKVVMEFVLKKDLVNQKIMIKNVVTNVVQVIAARNQNLLKLAVTFSHRKVVMEFVLKKDLVNQKIMIKNVVTNVAQAIAAKKQLQQVMEASKMTAMTIFIEK